MSLYSELHIKTAYSFLEGASQPQDLVKRALNLGYKSIAITDRNGFYGLPKAFEVCKNKPNFKLICGAELSICNEEKTLYSILLLAKTRWGYGRLSKLLTHTHQSTTHTNSDAIYLSQQEFLEFIESHYDSTSQYNRLVQEWFVIYPHNYSQDLDILPTLQKLFHHNFYLEVTNHFERSSAKRITERVAFAGALNAQLVATNDVYYHEPSQKIIQDAFTCLRTKSFLDENNPALHQNNERYLKSPNVMARLFSHLPEALNNTAVISEQITFSMDQLRYRYPSEWIPENYTADQYLRKLTYQGANKRYEKAIPADVRTQIEHELDLIQKLYFADYFLTIYDIVLFAKENQILCQGRGSAANSVVCYCLGITAIDPVRMHLLFERFISIERNEPPDIDVDFEHHRREEVIQYIYQRYGRDRAAMVSAVVTFQRRMCKHELQKITNHEMVEILTERMRGLPRHLSIHSGGFTLSGDCLDEIVPIEPATMEGRTIIQWDKNDLEILGLLKIDILALGALTVIHDTCRLTGLEFSNLPAEDKATYDMICQSDTVGTFQIESRAQINMLGRLQPRNFYDLVIEIALVRPGPIVGNMVHPYLKRRQGIEPTTIPHPDLEPILGRTLGIPLFQEQVMKMASTLAGFTPGESDQLRRAIGGWRTAKSNTQYDDEATPTTTLLGARLKQGLLNSGLPEHYVEQVFLQIQGFAEYGFPESHAASFALICYASCYLKCHHPAAFLCATLNAQPMGFYAPHTLIEDAKRHAVTIHGVDVNQSQSMHTLVDTNSVQLGFRMVSGFSEKAIQRILEERAINTFSSIYDFINRSRLPFYYIERLILLDAFRSVTVNQDQRTLLWDAIRYYNETTPLTTDQLSLFERDTQSTKPTPFYIQMSLFDEVMTEYTLASGSAKTHPMKHLRTLYTQQNSRGLAKIYTCQTAKYLRHKDTCLIMGLIITKQQPPTAGGVVFLTIEDESGFIDLILHQPIYQKFKAIIKGSAFIKAHGVVQRSGLSVSILVKTLQPLYLNGSPSDAANTTTSFYYSNEPEPNSRAPC